jgi:hypothetical protein
MAQERPSTKEPRLHSPTPPITVSETQPQSTLKEKVEIRLSLRADRNVYKDGDRVTLKGVAVTEKGERVRGFCKIEVRSVIRSTTKEDKKINITQDAPPLYSNLVEIKDGEYKDDGLVVFKFLDTDKEAFQINAEVTNMQGTKANTSIVVEREDISIWKIVIYIISGSAYILAFFMYFGALFLLSPTKRSARAVFIVTFTMVALFIISPLVLPAIISLSPVTETVMKTSPIGFLKAAVSKPENPQWVLNIGGILAEGKFKSGLQVPLYVLVFALIGAAVNMLWQLPSFIKTYHAIPQTQETATEQEKKAEADAVTDFRSSIIRYYVYFFAAPFLGTIFYCFLILADLTNTYALSIASFSVGFVSESLLEAIIAFGQKYLKVKERPKEPTSKGKKHAR